MPEPDPQPLRDINTPPPRYVPPANADSDFRLTSYDNPWITALAPIVVSGIAVAVAVSPLGFFLSGFQVWTHEFGHATVAWLTGHRALPLPIGWTNTGPKTPFVYFGILFLLAVLAVAGIKERRIWAVIIAVGIAIVQLYMTWWLPDYRVDLWLAFSGIGGEFYLSAAMIALFHVRLPAKFRWGGCRYLFVFLGASTFFTTWLRWRHIRYGMEPPPYGSMVNGEEDAGGDLNILHDDYNWSDRQIINAYHNLGTVCIISLVVIHLIFATGLHRPFVRAAEKD